MDNILFEKKGRIAYLTINRPRALNALTAATLGESGEAVAEIEADAEVGVVIVSGAGGKAFVAGADISQMQKMDSFAAKEFSLLGQGIFSRIETSKKVYIAAIDGFALGGGCELAMACDIRVASEKSKFGQPEAKLGVIPGFAGTQRLPRLVGKGVAKELIFTCDTVSAARAKEVGLVNHVVTSEELMPFCENMANTILKNSPMAVSLCKQSIEEGLEMDFDKGQAHEASIFGLCFAHPEQQEGMTAFLEKRKPNF
jgi:enoyl-CoA hydratase